MSNNTEVRKRKAGAGRKKSEASLKALESYQLDPKKMINFSELSRSLSGSSQPVRDGKIAHEYVNDVARLLNAVIDWYEGVQKRRKE